MGYEATPKTKPPNIAAYVDGSETEIYKPYAPNFKTPKIVKFNAVLI